MSEERPSECLYCSSAPETLYKYREAGNTNHLRIIESLELYLPRPNSFNDPAEYSIPIEWEYTDQDSMIRAHQDVAAPTSLFDEFTTSYYGFDRGGVRFLSGQGIRERGAVVCLTEDPLSPLMWSHYASSHRGFCIGFRTEYLAYDLRAPLIFRVGYTSSAPKAHPLHSNRYHLLAQQLATKSVDWAYEKEWRFVLDQNLPPTRTVHFSPQSVNSIHFGRGVAESEMKAIRRLAERRFCSEVRFYKVAPDATGLHLVSEQWL